MRVLLFCVVAVVSVWGQGAPLPPILRLPDEIRPYLALTEAQAQKIAEQNSEFSQWSSARSQRMYDVRSEIVVEIAREPLDPAALGVRYAEVEAIRREVSERNTKLIAANVAVLTLPQAVKLKALEEAMKLAPIGSQAQSLRLLPDCVAPNPVFYAGDFSLTPIIWDPVGGVGSSCAGDAPAYPAAFLTEIRTYLALTDPQTQKISEQNDEFADWSSARSQRMYAVQSEIVDETAREPLDPAALGVRYAEIEAIRREMAERKTKLIAANTTVLIPPQDAKLKALEEAMKLALTRSQAKFLKLLPGACFVPTASMRAGDFGPISTPVTTNPAASIVTYLGGYCGLGNPPGQIPSP